MGDRCSRRKQKRVKNSSRKILNKRKKGKKISNGSKKKFCRAELGLG